MQNIVTSAAGWVALSEIPYATHTLQKVALVVATSAECVAEGLIVTPNKETGKCFLPTTVVAVAEGGSTLYRLPLPLAEWALNIVAIAQYAGKSPFPKEVTIGVRDGHTYAQDSQ